MAKRLTWMFAAVLFAAAAPSALAQSGQSRPSLARKLFEGCLKSPSEATTLLLASAVKAVPYSDARLRHERPTDATVIHPEPGKGEAQRTRTRVVSFDGWDLPGQSAGNLEYLDQTSQIDWIEQGTGKPVTPVRVSHDRTCTVHAPVENARSMFELLESLTTEDYGVRISADRKWVDLFIFDPDSFDIELNLTFDHPLKGVAPAPESEGESRVVLSDGGPRFSNSTAPGIPRLGLTRESLLAGLDQPADMVLLNTKIEPVVQRLAETR